MAIAGASLRLASTAVRALQFLASVLVLGIFSYFLAVLADKNLPIARWIKAVEGISGIAVLYAGIAVVLTCCLGGLILFAFLAIVLDVCFMAGFVAIAILTRAGAHSCNGNVSTPLGSGNANSGQGVGGTFGFGSGDTLTYSPNLGRACKLEKAVFAVAVANIVLFILSALLQLALGRHHQKEKRYGPGPSNNYTSGFGKRRFFKRNRKGTRNVEGGALAAGGLGTDKGPTDYGMDGGGNPAYGAQGYRSTAPVRSDF